MEESRVNTNQSTINWTHRIVPIVIASVVVTILDNFLHVAPFFNFGLALPVALLPLYWLVPNRKVSFAKALMVVLGASCLVLITLCLIPELLSRLIPRGWAYGLTVFVVLQSIFWIPKRVGKQSIPPSICLAGLLISFLLALLTGIFIRSYDIVR